jgi:hypothetical protein
MKEEKNYDVVRRKYSDNRGDVQNHNNMIRSNFLNYLMAAVSGCVKHPE